MGSPYFYEQIIRHRYDEMRRNELQAQLAAHARVEREQAPRPARRLSWRRVPRFRAAIS